jgi:glycosyltransferase involved in cell wall biosynthesis
LVSVGRGRRILDVEQLVTVAAVEGLGERVFPGGAFPLWISSTPRDGQRSASANVETQRTSIAGVPLSIGRDHASPEPAADVYVIVRCYNEAPMVGKVIAELKQVFPNVVAVNDGSTDGSGAVMRATGAWVVSHAINLGAGAALQTGLQCALLDEDARFFVCFDADGQHRVEDAYAMVERMRVENLDILIGSRFLGSALAVPRHRRHLLKLARYFERFNSGLKLTDAHNGLRVFSRRFAERVDLAMPDMAYASELLSVIAKTGYPYGEHPVSIAYSEYSIAKGQRSINSVNIAIDVWLHRLFGRGRR